MIIERRGFLLLNALGTVALLSRLVGFPAPAFADRIFVSNFGDDTVSVIDTDLDREIGVIPAGESPLGLALRPQAPLLAVANSQASRLTLIDPITLEALPDPVPAGKGPEDVAFSADGNMLFATSYYERTVTVSDVAARKLVGEPIAFSRIPRRLLLAPDGTRLFVSLHDEEGAVAVIDTATFAIEKTIPVGPFPTAFVLAPDGTRLFVASYDAKTVTIIDVATLKPIETFDLETGVGLTIHPIKPFLYSFLDFDAQVLVFDYAARQQVALVDVGASPASGVVTPDGRFLYVVDNEANNVAKVDTETNTPLARIAVGMTPEAAVIFAMRKQWAPDLWTMSISFAAVLIILAVTMIVRQRRRRRQA